MLIEDSKTGKIYTVGQVARKLAFWLLAGVALGMAPGLLIGGCDSEADQSAIRRDQLGADIRSYNPPGNEGPIRSPGGGQRSEEDIASEVITKHGLISRRFNSITVLASGSGDITLTAESDAQTSGTPFDLIHRVELADGIATCVETGETLDGALVVAANLQTGLLELHSLDGSVDCSASSPAHEIGHAHGKPPTYSLWVGDLGN